MHKIFIQIASYRDKELLPTLRDIVAKSSKENQLSFGLVWQKDPDESIEEFALDNRVKIIDCDWEQSKGLGWARSLTQSLYNDEDYTLQLDSHHRFAQDWDKILIDIYDHLKQQSDKPLITAYAAGYDPNNDTNLVNMPCKVLPHDFKSSGTIWLNPVPMNKEETERPIRARFVSGHYFFTSGQHCVEYKYDPDLYFAGDEIALSARSYTMGYDLYHPHINVVWHHYGRNDRPKHWGDHTDKNKDIGLIEKTWKERDDLSKQRIRQLLGEEDYGIDLGIYGLGKNRSIADYEKYAGFDFKNRRILSKAINGEEPPILFDSEKEWEDGFKKIIPIVIDNYQIQTFLNYIDNISILKLDFECLHRKIIHSQNISKNILYTNEPIKTILNSDNVPMKFTLSALDNQLNTIYKFQRDLRKNIHWN